MTDLTPDKLDEIEKASSALRASIGDHWSSEEGFAGDGWGEHAAHYLATMDPATTLALVARVRELEAQAVAARKAHWRIDDDVDRHVICEGCFADWPCDTIKALGEES